MSKIWLDECLVSLISEHPLTVNISKRTKYLSNLHETTLIILFADSQQDIRGKKSLLLIFSPLGLIVKTLTADDKYSLPNSENMREPIQMQLYKILKTYSRHFVQLVQSTSNFKHFEKKDDPLSVCIFEVTHCERHRYTNV